MSMFPRKLWLGAYDDEVRQKMATDLLAAEMRQRAQEASVLVAKCEAAGRADLADILREAKIRSDDVVARLEGFGT